MEESTSESSTGSKPLTFWPITVIPRPILFLLVALSILQAASQMQTMEATVITAKMIFEFGMPKDIRDFALLGR